MAFIASNAKKPTIKPMAMPPKKLIAKLCAASTRENAPVTAAAMANWNDTTPDASLISASPDSSDFWRPVSRMSLPNAVTATASVGPSAAPSAKAAASSAAMQRP